MLRMAVLLGGFLGAALYHQVPLSTCHFCHELLRWVN